MGLASCATRFLPRGFPGDFGPRAETRESALFRARGEGEREGEARRRRVARVAVAGREAARRRRRRGDPTPRTPTTCDDALNEPAHVFR